MRKLLAVFAASAMVIAVPGTALTQDVQYTTVNSMNLEGALGKAVSLAARLGGGATTTEQTTSVKGSKMRIDSEGSSTILDYDQARMVQINHRAKTYSVINWSDLAGGLQTALATTEPGRSNTSGTIAMDSADVDLDINFSVDRPGDSKSVAGYPARRFFMTVDVQGDARAKNSDDSQELGRLVLFTDMWNSSQIPAAEALQRFHADAAGAMAAGSGAGLTAALGQDPRMKPAMARAAAEASKVEGMTVQSTTYFVFVMPGNDFDRALLLSGGDDKDEESLTQKAASGMLRGALGRFGRKAEPKEEEPAEQPAQRVMMSMTEELRDVKTTTLPASLFEVPEGYREVPSGIPAGG